MALTLCFHKVLGLEYVSQVHGNSVDSICLILATMLQGITPLEIRIWMNNRITFVGYPGPVLLAIPNVPFMHPFEHPVACNMIPLPIYILLDSSKHMTVTNTRSLQQGRQVLNAEMTIWATMTFATAGRVLGQDFLAGIRRVTSSATVGVTTHVAIGMTDIITIFLVEGVVRYQSKGLPPKDQAVFHREPKTFKEKCVL